MMSMKTIRLAIPGAILFALCLLGFNESNLSITAWWSCLLPALLVLASWKYQMRRWFSQCWNPNMSEAKINSAKPLAYWYLGMYFFLVGGFLAAMIACQYYGFKIPVAAILAFLSLWWIKMEIWGLLLFPNGVRSESH